MQRLGVAIATIIAMATAACGGAADDGDDSAEGATSTNVSATAVDPEPDGADVETALRDAVSATVENELVGFSFRAVIFHRTVLKSDGVQRLRGGWSATATLDDPAAEGPRTMEARSADGRVWMTIKSWPAHLADCWLAMSSAEVPVGLIAMVPDEIGYVSLLAELAADDWEAGSTDYIDGSVGIAGAQTLLTSGVIEGIGLTSAQADDIRLDALVRMRGGRVARIEIQGQSLVDEIDRVGGTLSEQARVMTNAARWTVSYADAGTPPDGAPPEPLVMTSDELEQGCH